MPDAYVTRHGERWAVADDPAAPPISEHATRAEAESAARALAAGGGEVIVSEEDPSGLAGHEDAEVAERGGPEQQGRAEGIGPERLRGEQGSL